MADMTRLKEMRTSAGLTQKQLADAVGMDVQMVQAYEQGRRKLDGAGLKTILTFAEALGCHLSDLIADDETREMLKRVG